MLLLKCKESPWFLHIEDVYWTRYLKCRIVTDLCQIQGFDLRTISYDDLHSNSIQQLNNKSLFNFSNPFHCRYDDIVITLMNVLCTFSDTSRINIFLSFIKKGYVPKAAFLVHVVKYDCDLFALLVEVSKQYFSSNAVFWNQRAFSSFSSPGYVASFKNDSLAEMVQETFKEEDTTTLWNCCFAARYNVIFMKWLLLYPETSDVQVSSRNVAIICGLQRQNRCLLYALIHSKKKYAVDFSLLGQFMARLSVCECEWRVRFVLAHSQSNCIAKKWVVHPRTLHDGYILKRVFYCSKVAFRTLFHLVSCYPQFARALIEDERHLQMCLTFFQEVGHTRFTNDFKECILSNVFDVHLKKNMLALFDMYVKICTDGKLNNDFLQTALNLFAQAATDASSSQYMSHLKWKHELLWRYPYADIVIPRLSSDISALAAQGTEELFFFRQKYDLALQAKKICYSNTFLPPVIFNLVFWFVLGSDVFQWKKWLQLSTIFL